MRWKLRKEILVSHSRILISFWSIVVYGVRFSSSIISSSSWPSSSVGRAED
jgi:hypothetical protein